MYTCDFFQAEIMKITGATYYFMVVHSGIERKIFQFSGIEILQKDLFISEVHA